MTRKSFLLASSSLICIAFCPGVAQAQPSGAGPRIVQGRLLVKFRQSVSDAEASNMLASFRSHTVRHHPQIGVHVVALPAGASEAAFVKAFQARPEVEFAELDRVLPPADIIPDDPLYPMAWHLTRISAPSAWSTTTGSSAITVAIIDTGVYGSHEDLAAKMVPGWNVYDNNADTSDVYGHGTTVAGTVAAASNNRLGVTSIAWGCYLMPIRISAPDGTASFSTIANGIIWAADHGARVANVSYVASDSVTVSSAAQYLQSKGGVLTVSAGNYSTFDSNPINPYILTVSAADPNDVLYSWSNTGNNIALAAPGCVYTTLSGGGYGSECGTSYSAPIVAGVAALVLSVRPGLTPSQVTSLLEQSADKVGPSDWDSTYGWGRVNAARAVSLAASGSVNFTGSGCTYSISPLNHAALAQGEPSDSLLVTTPQTCAWSATTNYSWITVLSGSGSGNGGVSYAVAANSGAPRSGTLTIAGQTLTVTQAGSSNLPPSTVSVAPSSGSGSSQTFGFVFSDPNGFADLSTAYIGFSSALTFGNACYSYYDRNANTLWLLNDASNAWLGPVTPGAAATLQNNQCTLNGAGSAASGSGNNLTLNVALTFKAPFGGAKNVYMCALDNSGQSSNWQQRGTWTVPVPNNQPPSTVSVTPSSGSGSSQTFSFVFSDPNGYTDLSTTYLGFSSTFAFVSTCYSYYDRNANALWLLNDAANAWLGPVTPGAAGTLQNNQCTLNGAGSSASGSGNNLTVNVALTFKAPFGGVKNVYLCALDNSGLASNWQQRGNWTVPVPNNQPPTSVSVTPSSGNGSSQTFGFVFSDPNGFADLSATYLGFNSTFAFSGGCYSYYDRNANALWLLNDAANGWLGPVTPGAAGTLQNSQCTLNGAGSSVSGSGNNLTVNLALTFKAPFAGAKNVYMCPLDNSGASSNWQQKGTWTTQ